MGTNNFVALATINPGDSGPQASVDLWALVPTTGFAPDWSIICVGDFSGSVVIEASLNGVDFNPVASFDLGNNQSSASFEMSPIIVEDIVRYVRTRVGGNCLIRGPIYITLGGSVACDCPSSGNAPSINFVNSVNTTGTKLKTYDSSTSIVGDLVYVVTVGNYFKLTPNSTLTVDDITVVDASGLGAGFQWVRQNAYNKTFEVQTTWHIDPKNVTGTANDENDGLTDTTCLRSYNEHMRRWFNAFITTASSVFVHSDFNAGDEPAYNFRTSPLPSGQAVTFRGVPTQIWPAGPGSSTITTWTPESGAAAADDNQLVDASVPASFTASGMLADGVLFQRTNGTAAYWWAAKDLGGAAPNCTLRTGNPFVLSGAVTTLANGDSYTASTVPKIGAVRFTNSLDGDVLFNFLWHQDTDAAAAGRPIRYGHVWRQSSTGLKGNSNVFPTCVNVGMNGALSSLTLNGLFTTLNGVFRGAGNTSMSVGPDGYVSASRLTLQGVGTSIQGHLLLTSRLTVHDTTAAGVGCLVPLDGGLVSMRLSGCIGGKGNTQKLANVGEGIGAIRSGGTILIMVATPWDAASTSDANPININNTGFTVAHVAGLYGGAGAVIFAGVPIGATTVNP